MKKILLYADSYAGRVGINDAYVRFASQFGEVILVTAVNDLNFFMKFGDVLFLPGGADVDPYRYGERPYYLTGRTNPHYEYLDLHLLTPWLKTGKPIIGICRGMQTLNVAMGGSLYQHIDGHAGHPDRREETLFDLFTNVEPDTDAEGNPISYTHLYTNSYHHQAVKDLAPGFDVIGWSPAFKNCESFRNRKKPIVAPHYKRLTNKQTGEVTEKPLGNYYSHIEIIKHRDRPYLGIQYHPEEFNCELAVKLISETLEVIPEIKPVI